MKILLLNGLDGSLGYGDMKTSKLMKGAIEASGNKSEILYIHNSKDLLNGLKNRSFDMVWSSLYQANDNVSNLNPGKLWVADILDEKNIPYIGPNAAVMKTLIDKHATHKKLSSQNIPVPYQYFIKEEDPIPKVIYPAIVKPYRESCHRGISEKSVVNCDRDLEKRVRYVHDTFQQEALVEEYLSGTEMTVLMIGNGEKKEFLVGEIEFNKSSYDKYNVLSDEKESWKAYKLVAANGNFEYAQDLAKMTMEPLNCLDHVRADMRMDSKGVLKIIEVNGIPGLNLKSWSPNLHKFYNPELNEKENYQTLINKIVDSGMERYNL